MIDFNNLSTFIAFVSSPNKTASTSFFYKNFKSSYSPIFAKYKEDLNQHFKSGGKFDDCVDKSLYNPNGYLLFGKYDLLLFTLTDDTEFANRNFCPFPSTQINIDYKPENFDFQVFSNLIPKINNLDLIEKYEKVTSPSFTQANPFILSIQLKLNPSLLIGNGIEYLENILSFINSEVDNIENIEHLCLLNLGSHEIILLLFSNSTVKLSDTLFKIRELSINKICENKEKFKIKDKFLKNSLLFNWQDEKMDDNQEYLDKFDNHIFVDTISNFGVHTDFINNTNITDSIDVSNLQLVTKWFVKPGHFKKAYDSINDNLNSIVFSDDSKKNVSLTLGRGDMVVNNLMNFNELNGRELFVKYIKFLNNKHKNITYNIRECITSVSFEFKDEVLFDTFRNSEHWYSIDNVLSNRCSVKPSTIIKYENKLKRIGAPKILIEKVISICNIFNNVIQDEVLFGSFIELEAFLKIQILQKINDYSKNRLPSIYYIKEKSEIIRELTDSCRIFESAFHDRFFQTHRTADLTDINLDYKGAIHQQLSIYDSLFKFFGYNMHFSQFRNIPNSYVFGLKSYYNISPQIVYISDEIGINSTKNSLKINQQHIFEPYIFLSVFLHEISNFMMDSILDNLKGCEKYSDYIKYFNSQNFKNKCSYKPIDPNDCSVIPLESVFKRIIIKLKNRREKKILHYLIEHDDFNAYLYVDILTYSTAFNQNIKQYTYWHINYLLLQANQLHDSTHNISKKNMTIILFRLFIVYKLSGNKVDDELFDKIYKMIPRFYFSSNSKDDKTRNDFKQFFQDINNSVNAVIESEDLKDMFAIIRDVNENIFSDYKDKLTDITDINYHEKSNHEIDKFSNLIREITTENYNITDNDFKYKLLDVIRNYIYIIHEYNGQGTDLISIIERDRETGIVVNNFNDNENKFADFCFDSAGGIFTISAPFRKRLHLLNSYLYIGLWDFTQKYKREYF